MSKVMVLGVAQGVEDAENDKQAAILSIRFVGFCGVCYNPLSKTDHG